MKPKTFHASQLDPRSVVITIKEHNKAVESLKKAIVKSYRVMCDNSEIDKEVRDKLIRYLNDF